MGRAKKKKPKAGYFAGATWRDVMTGRAVTGEDLKRRERKKERPVPTYQCRRCPNAWRPGRHVARPTCTLCGGIMDPAFARAGGKDGGQ
jgi:hypothetical protein